MPDTVLTDAERSLADSLGECASEYARIRRSDPVAPPPGQRGSWSVSQDTETRADDINEFVSRVHDLQARVLARAAARAYPDEFRLL